MEPAPRRCAILLGVGQVLKRNFPIRSLKSFKKIKQIPEIVECHHISGKYSLLIKVYTRNNEHLKKIIVEQIQSIPEISFTETFISLEEGFDRQLPAKSL